MSRPGGGGPVASGADAGGGARRAAQRGDGGERLAAVPDHGDADLQVLGRRLGEHRGAAPAVAERRLVLARLVPLFVFAPLFSSRMMPMRARGIIAVALAVGLTPELLPMVTTVTLSRGALRMAARKVIVKRLAAIHDLGAMTVLCTDKTGTLTAGKPRVTDVVGQDQGEVLRLAAAVEQGSAHPLARAVLEAAAARGIVPPPATEGAAVPAQGGYRTLPSKRSWDASFRDAGGGGGVGGEPGRQ